MDQKAALCKTHEAPCNHGKDKHEIQITRTKRHENGIRRELGSTEKLQMSSLSF